MQLISKGVIEHNFRLYIAKNIQILETEYNFAQHTLDRRGYEHSANKTINTKDQL